MTDAYRPEDDPILGRLRRREEQATRQAYTDPLAPNPEEAANVRRLSEESGLPEADIFLDLGAGERAAQAAQAERALQTTPRLREWIADPRNSTVARDDIESLSVFERASLWAYRQGDRYRALGAHGDQAATSAFMLDPLGASSYIASRLVEPQEGFGFDVRRLYHEGELDQEQRLLAFRRAELENQGLDLSPEETGRLDELRERPGQDDYGAFVIGPTARLLPLTVEGFKRAGREGAEGYRDTTRFVRGAPGSNGLLADVVAAPFGALGAFGGGAGGYLANVYEQETGGLYDTLRQQDVAPEIAYQAATEYGRWATVLEFVSDATGIRAGSTARLVGRTFLRESALRPVLSSAAGRAGTAVAGGAASQAFEESSQRLAEIIHEDLAQQESQGQARDVGAAWREALTVESIQSMLHSAYIGAQGGAGMAAAPAGVNYGLDIRAAQRAEQNAATFEEWTRAAQASKLSERGLVSTLESAVGAMDDSSVYIDADQWLEHFQGANANPYTVADELGIGAENLAQAVASHGQVQMPTSTFAARVLRLPEHAKLAEHARISPTDMTPAEAKAADEVFRTEVEQLAAEVETATTDNEIGAIVETRMRELFAAAAEEGGPRSAVSARYARLVAAMPRALLARARATNPEYAQRLEGQLRTLFGQNLDIAGPAREAGEQGTGLEQPKLSDEARALLSPDMGYVMERRLAGLSNREIAAEMETTANAVGVQFNRARKRLAEAGLEVDLQIGRTGRPREELTDRVGELRAQGLDNAAIMERLGLTPKELHSRLQALRAREQNRRAEPFDLHTPEGRAVWFKQEVLAEPIPGEASDARQYGFALDSGDVVVMTIAPEPTGSATVDWTWLNRLKDPTKNPYGKGDEKLTMRQLLGLMARQIAVIEHDMATFSRDAYVYTPYEEGIENFDRRLVARITQTVPYSMTEDGAGAFYVIRDGAAVAKNGQVIPSPENANAPPIDWPQLDPQDVQDAQAAFLERLERFAKDGAPGGVEGDGGRDASDGGSGEAGAGVSGTGGTRTLEQPGRNDGIGRGGLPIRPREPGRQSFVGGSEDLMEAARFGYRGQDTGEAAEWVRAREKGLPMDEASRMARAKEQGFDTEQVLYHGTHEDIAAFDLDAAGSGANAGLVERAIFLTDAPRVADSYLGGGYIRADAPDAVREGAAPMGNNVGRWYSDGANVQPVFVRDIENFDNWEWGGGGYTPGQMAARIEEARRDGKSGLILRNIRDPGIMDAGPLGLARRPSNLVVIFDPSNIRSIHAAFDPDYRDSADLLAQDEAGQGEARGSIRYDKFKAGEFGEAVIRLGEASDLSTFLHEFGHLGHLILESIATDPEAPAEFKAMWENTLQWWGVSQEEWSALAPEAKVDHFERWARTFEAYLMEGKAPSLGLREAFAAFKEWLKRIYTSLFRLDHNLNPEIRDVFDRMLATDAEMAEARAAQGADFALAREAFATEEEFAQYQQAISEARDAQEAELRARVMDAHARKSKRWWRGERERMRPAAARHVDSDPARRAEQWLGAGEWRPLPETTLSDEGETGYVAPADAMEEMPEGLPEMSLSAEALAADWPDAQLPPAVAPRTDVETVLAEAMALKAVSKGRGPARAARLWKFIKDNGGINLSGLSEEQRTAFMAALGSGRKRPGLINNKDGKTPEELMALAAEAGYFGKGAARELHQPTILWTPERIKREGYAPTGRVHSADYDFAPVAADHDAAAAELGVPRVTALFTDKGWEWFVPPSAARELRQPPIDPSAPRAPEGGGDPSARIAKPGEVARAGGAWTSEDVRFAHEFLEDPGAAAAYEIPDAANVNAGQRRPLLISENPRAPEGGGELEQGGELFSDKAPSLEEFMAALTADLKNERQVFSAKDPEALASAQALADAQAWFDANEIDLTKPKEEIREQIVAALERARNDPNAVHPDTAAEFFGFSSGDHLIRALSALKPRAVAIEDRIDSMVEEEHGDAASPDKIQEAARLAAHVEAQSRRIEMELAALQKATGGRARPVGRAARKYAEDQVSRMSVREVRGYEKFLAGERRAARNAADEAAKGNHAEAARQKSKQLVSFHLYRFARDAAEEMDTLQSYFRKFEREGVRKKFLPAGGRHLEQIDQLLETLDLRKNPYPSNRARATFKDYLAKLEAEGVDTADLVEMDEQFLAAVQRRPFASLSIEEARSVRDVVQNFEAMGVRWNRVLTDRKNRLLGEVVDGLVDQVLTEWPKKATITPSLASRSRFQQAIDLVMDLHASQTKMEQLVRAMDGWKANGPWFNAFIPASRRAQSNKNDRLIAAVARMYEIISVYSKKELGRMLVHKEYIPVIGDSLTRMQQIAVLLYSGTAYRRDGLMKGFQWNEEQLQAVIDNLSERDVRFAQEVWAFLDSFKAESFDLDERVRGVRPTEDPGIMVQTRSGPIQGSYFPIKFDPDRSNRAAKRASQEAVEQLSGGSYRQTGTKRGRLKQLQGTAGQAFRLDPISIIAEHIEETVHDLSHREFVIDARRMLASERVRTAVAQVMGPWGVKVVDAWIAKVEQPKPPLNSNSMMARWERIAGKIKNNATVVNMGLKVTTALIQELGTFNAIPRTGILPMLKQKGITVARDYPEFLARQTARLFGAPETLPARIQFIFDRSPFMRQRMTDRDRDVRDAAASRLGERPGILPQVPKDAQDSMMIFSGLMDMAVSAPAWLAGYESALAGKVKGIEQGDEQAAIDHADSIIATTQSGGAPMDLSAILASDNQFWRLLTMFMSWSNTFYNQMFVEQIPAVMSGKMTKARFAANMLFVWFLPAFAAMWFYGRLEPQDGEDDDEFKKRVALEAMIYPGQGIPIIRDALNAYVTGYDYQFTPAQAAMEAPIKLARAAERGDSEEVVKQGLMTAGYAMGLPSRQMWITGEGITDIATGEEDVTEDPVDSARELFIRDTR